MGTAKPGRPSAEPLRFYAQGIAPSNRPEHTEVGGTWVLPGRPDRKRRARAMARSAPSFARWCQPASCGSCARVRSPIARGLLWCPALVRDLWVCRSQGAGLASLDFLLHGLRIGSRIWVSRGIAGVQTRMSNTAGWQG